MHFSTSSTIIILVADEETKTKQAPLAHLVEHLTLNQGVRGSSPRRPTCKSIGFAEEAAESVFFLYFRFYTDEMQRIMQNLQCKCRKRVEDDL